MSHASRPHRAHRLSRALGVAVLAAALAVVPTSGGAGATGKVLLTGYGGDSCTAPSESQMSAFWRNTPFSYWGIYIGGSDRGCTQPNLTRTWVSHMLTMGWDLMPIWVGRQNPCTPGQAAYFSTNTATAYKQGKAEALAAYNAWRTLSSVTYVPIVYDLEASSTDTTSCREAARWFIDGWTNQLHVAPAQVAGVYTSTCAGHLDDYSRNGHPPDFVDGAAWDGVPATSEMPCVPSTHWTRYQRHKQYRGGHNATYNGVTLNIDSDCANGPVYGVVSRTSTTQACAPQTASATASTTSGALVTAADAQVAGVQWHGARWRAGGPLNSQLQRASNSAAAWSAVPMGTLPLTLHDVPVTAAAIGTPVPLADGSLLVPVTRHDASGLVDLYTTRDGRRFTRRVSIPRSGTLGAGVAVSATGLGSSRVLVLDPAGASGQLWSPSGTSRVAVRGLPAAPSAVAFDNATSGEASVEGTTCPGATKSGCRPTERVYRSADGGRTWRLSS